MNAVEKRLQEAESFPDLSPPNHAQEYGRVVKGGRTYIVYVDEEGKAYYDTVQGREFKRMMQEAAKKNIRKRKWC